MTTVHIRLFGPFEVLRDGQPLTVGEWRNQQTRTILKVLLARRGRVVTADQLLELLWPDADPPAARRRLHVRVSQLRRILSPDEPAAYLLTVEEGYTFDPQANCWLDTVEFEARVRQGRGCQEDGDLAQAIDAYESARALYRGDFLEEDLYQDWTFVEREWWRERFLSVLTELAECYACRGHYRRAITRCRQVLVADPCRESVYVRLMLYHYYAGEQDRALRVYERCRRVLADELGVEPLPQTADLHTQILQRQVRPVDGAARYPPPVYAGRLFKVPYSLGRTPFVGREREYAWLVEQLQPAATGGGRVAAIAGEAGLGKTRLAQTALGYAQQQGRLALSSRCYEVEADVPYYPLAEALRPLMSGDAALPSDALAGEWLADLAPLFPTLRHRDPRRSPVAAGQQNRLFEAVSRLLAAATARRPIAIFIDDVQWADTASLSLLGHLMHHTAGQPLAWLVAYRLEEVAADHPLRPLLDGLRREGRLAELELTPLPADAVAALVAQISGGSGVAPALSQRLAQESGGNPFYLVSILQNLFEEGILSIAADGDWVLSRDLVAEASELMLPPTLRKTLERRLERLARSDRRVLEAAAVLERRFDFDLLQRTAGLEEDTLLDALDRLTESRLLEERSLPDDLEYDFSHDKLRRVTYLCTRAARRRRLHRRAAEALLALRGDDPTRNAELAYHYHRAACPADAVGAAIRAGEHALWLYAVQQAAAHFADAIRWATEANLALSQEQLTAIHVGWGDALRRSGRYDEALPHYLTALPLAQGERKQAVAYHICSLGAIRGGNLAGFDRMAPLLERELAGAGDSWPLAWLRWTQGYVEMLRGDAARARACAAEGWRVARRLNAGGDEASSWLQSMIYIGMAHGYNWWAHWRRAIRYARKGLALCAANDDRNGAAALHAVLGAAYYGLGEWGRALDHLAYCHSLAAEAGDQRLAGEALYNAALVHLERGDRAAVQENARRIVAAAEATGDVVRQGFGRLLEARLAIKRGAPQEAIPLLQMLLQAARWAEASTLVVLVLRFLAEAHLLADEPGPAVSTAREGIELAARSGQQRECGGLLRVLGEALARAGQPVEAEQCLRQAVALAERIGCRYDLAEAHRSLAGLCRAAGGKPFVYS
jgi:DNA-binding SARP family transcriptional activator/RecA/RadA recombinase